MTSSLCSLKRDTISGLLAYWANYGPDRPFLQFERQADDPDQEGERLGFSYGEFDGRVNQACHLLRDMGIAHGDVVNLHLTNCPEFLVLWFALARIGAVMMPTNVHCTPDELGYLLTHSGAKLCFASADHAATAAACVSAAGSLRQVIICGGGADNPESDHFDGRLDHYPDTTVDCSRTGLDLVSIMYTSGTTSRPKGVMVTNTNYLTAGATVANHLSLTGDDRQFIVLPLFHGNAQYYSTMSALLRGASIALMDRFSASRFFDRCIDYRCTVASLFAAPLRMILAQTVNASHGDNTLRAVLYAQNITDRQHQDWMARFRAPLRQLWGMTETMGPPLMTPLVMPVDRTPLHTTIGLPAGDYDVELVDESGHRVGTGRPGQIRVRGRKGRSVMAGYHNDSVATDRTIQGEWLYSGDNAIQDSSGYFYFVDRAKDMIKRSGENISAAEVESVVMDCPGVFECAVVGLPDPVRDETIVVVVVAVSGATIDPTTIIDYCAERLSKFRVPERVVVWAQLPKTSVGKIQKHIVRATLMSE